VVVSSLDLQVQPGDLYGFLGPNGAGKTTAIRCILGLIRRDRGDVRIFGEPAGVAQRRRVGALVETPQFHEWLSGRMNLEIACAYAGEGTRADIDRALEQVGLAERAKDQVRGYSLGMRQRLGIARALVGRPRLLILDEPTNGLDPRGMREVRDLLKLLVRRDGLTVFVSSHLLAEVEAMCNRVAIIDRGVLKAEGRVSELVRQGGDGVEVEVEVSDASAARAVVGRLEGASGGTTSADGRILVRLHGLSPAGLNRALVAAGIDVSHLATRAASLEDRFLELTVQDPELSAAVRGPGAA
jgi:ABC-2 type transport system ATP-binding protein